MQYLTARERFTIGVLCFCNIINYMDRFAIAGVLLDIQEFFKIGNDLGGLLQSGFIIAYMVSAPAFGYLGDRYSRRLIMILCLVLWSTATLVGSFTRTYGLFFTFRLIMAIGEAGFSSLVPTTISDMVVNESRSMMLALLYLAIPVGSGLGYAVGAEMARFAGGWWWAMRVTPLFGLSCALMLAFTVDPERGGKERPVVVGLVPSLNDTTTTTARNVSFCEAFMNLLRNRSFTLMTGGYTCVTFSTGALAWWGPKCLLLGFRLIPGMENTKLVDVAYRFGAITVATGILGVLLGTCLSQTLRPRLPRVDPIICGTGLLVSVPLIILTLITAPMSSLAAIIFVFFGQLALNVNWSVVADMLLYVVSPTQRSMATALQIFFSHTFGDAGSPVLIGFISEILKKRWRSIEEYRIGEWFANAMDTFDKRLTTAEGEEYSSDTISNENEFKSLQYALSLVVVAQLFGGILFQINAIYILDDRARAIAQLHGNPTVAVVTA